MLSSGKGTLKIPLELFSLNRERLVNRLKENGNSGVVILQGGEEVSFYDTDTTYNVFRQESYFIWAFGVTEPGCYGAIDILSGVTILFIPRHPAEYAFWMGPLPTPSDFSTKYGISKVCYVDEIKEVIAGLKSSQILTLKGLNTDSHLTAKPARFPGIEEFKIDEESLFPVIADLRVYKTPLEIRVIKYVVAVSSYAHRRIMKMIKPGDWEYQAESEFLNICYKKGGCRHASYTCICGSGVNGAILHYGHAGAPNKSPIQDGVLCLFDMGANYFGYAADITCTFPANGKFTDDQRLIYEAVLKANFAVQKAAKPGVSWVDMHLLANRVMLKEMKTIGLLKGNLDDMIESGLAAIFQPHGLGHLMGLDVHDVGGYLASNPKRPEKLGLNKLRTARVLEANMVLTIEPGCYFIDPLLDKALQDEKLSQYLVPEVLERFRGFGGVRIEDDVLITENGVLNLTCVPRTVEEIEDWINNNQVDELKYQDSERLFVW
ncbi:xaa-Pro dipeptidase [Cylas formicarius]|uniref:xaa-Pro dipeptidase n=1 Tax=Cylas formicarius TaxID=197179 RepID=UPI0029583AB8|nr:xaa-Pro dipeptidase [Cylas formicarius]XP_060515903.1 xaa-Pro dipeptidase [Cylas formicarius]XP_060515904.1 xaa-Pro dipeptidase [Cylas formicarius]